MGVAVDDVVVYTIGAEIGGNRGQTEGRHDVGDPGDVAAGTLGAVAQRMNEKYGGLLSHRSLTRKNTAGPQTC
jgi:hypothetical protein